MTHLIMPPKKVTDEGPVKSPVQTGFTLSNGNEQPFIHLVYMESALDGMQRIS